MDSLQHLYGFLAEQRNIRRQWLKYIFTTSTLIIGLSFATALTAAVTEYPSLVVELQITMAITTICSLLMIVHAKYTRADLTIKRSFRIYTWDEWLISACFSLFAGFYSIYLAKKSTPFSFGLFIYVNFCIGFIFSSLSALAKNCQELFGGRTVVYGTRHYKGRAFLFNVIFMVLFSCIFSLVHMY